MKQSDPPLHDETNPPIDSEVVDIIDEDNLRHSLQDSPFMWEEDSLAGIYFIQYGDYFDLEHIFESPHFHLLSKLFPNMKTIARVQTNEGELILMLISRYKDTSIVIKDDEDFILYEDDNFDTIFLRCNESELRPDTKITIKHDDEEVTFEPYLSMMDSRFELPKEILDISYYTQGDLLGGWETEDFIISFEENNDVEIYMDDKTYVGHVYFEVPVDFKEDYDNAPSMIYFDLISENGHQLFSKYVYGFNEDGTLNLKHIGYDRLTQNTVHWLRQPN